jgi:hypothetical protein
MEDQKVSKNEELELKVKEILEGAEDPNNMDDVALKMFSAGIPFAKIKGLYTKVGIELGLVSDPAKIKKEISDALDGYKEDDAYPEIEDLDSWTQVEAFCEEIADGINGANTNMVLKALKALAKENGIALPEVTKTAGTRKKGGKLSEAIITYANKYKDINLQGLYEAILPTVKGTKNAEYHAGANIVVIYAVKYGKTFDEATEAVVKMGKIVVAE